MKKSLCRFALLLLLLPAAALAESHPTGEGSDAPGDPTATVGEAPTADTGGSSASEELESVGCEDNSGCTDGNVCRDGTCVSAQGATKDTGFTALAPIPGLTDNINGAVVRSEDLANFLNNLYRYLIGLAAALAVIMITWGGIEWATQDIPAQKASGKEKIRNAIFGLVLILSPYVVFSIINPAILNLSIGLKPLKTQSGPAPYVPPSNNQSSTGDTQTQKATNCTDTGTLLKKASCPSEKDAQDFAASCESGAGKVSSSFLSSKYSAVCETTGGPKTGPYAFLDTSKSAGFQGWVNRITGYSYYEPLASVPTNPNNGNDVLQFAAKCNADGGTTCMSAIKTPIPVSACTYGSNQKPSADVSFCWAIELYCTDGNSGAGGCSTKPDFKIIQ